MDSFEKLIPIIFLIVWTIIAMAAKKKKKQQQSPPGRSKPRNPLLGKLQSSLETMFTEMQPKNVEMFEPESTFDNAIEETDMEVTIPEIKIAPPKTVEKRKSSSHPYAYTPAKKNKSTARLREAVIWSEILGKPVSMRD